MIDHASKLYVCAEVWVRNHAAYMIRARNSNKHAVQTDLWEKWFCQCDWKYHFVLLDLD